MGAGQPGKGSGASDSLFLSLLPLLLFFYCFRQCFAHFQVAVIKHPLPFLSPTPLQKSCVTSLCLTLVTLCYSRVLSGILERDYSYIAKVRVTSFLTLLFCVDKAPSNEKGYF